MKKFCILLIVLSAIIPACSSPTVTPQTTVTATASPQVTATVTKPTATSQVKATTNPTDTKSSDVKVAAQMAFLFSDMQLVNKYYDDGLSAMAQVKPGSTKLIAYGQTTKFTIQLARVSSFPWNISPQTAQVTISNVPTEFLKPLPGNGVMPAPQGACPAAAQPSVTFKTVGGAAVTPELIANKNLKAIPSQLLTMDQNSPGSLSSMVETAVQSGDKSLATPQGWNTLLWDKLKAQQTPPQSLMDYQLWNASADLEQQITALYLQRIEAAGAPEMVINAFKASSTSGWYTSTKPTPNDALARMEIEAKMTGSLNGTVQERRDFTIAGAGNTPTYGTQTGAGTVTWNHPELGPMNFEVNINLDKFDEKGRAIGGTTIGVDSERGYEIRFTFNPDGTKKGELFKDGKSVGLMTMTINADKFENYIDVKTNQSEPLPAVKQR